jgi:hypothetical protein
VQAIRRSLLIEDQCAARHGVYAKRKPVLKYEKPAEIHDRDSATASDFEGCVE